MMVRNVWILLTVSVLLATVVSSRQVPGVGKGSVAEWQSSLGSSRPDLTGQNNRTVFNWKNPLQENEWHPQNPSRIGLNLHPLPHKGSDQGVGLQKMGKSLVKYVSLSQKLFANNLSKKIRTMALSTNFVTGMGQGTLPLPLYRNYLVQDAFYLFHVARLYKEAAKKLEGTLIEENVAFANFFWEQYAKFRKHHEDFITIKKVPLTEEASVAMQRYISFLEGVISGQNDPRLLVVALLPCSMIYPELAREVEVINPEGINVYEKDWFQENRREGETSTEKFVNENLQLEQKSYLLLEYIFVHGSLNELNFHLEIGRQPPLTLEDIQKAPLH